jgi:predicted DNA-binding protein (MmcQ/YjbR family)
MRGRNHGIAVVDVKPRHLTGTIDTLAARRQLSKIRPTGIVRGIMQLFEQAGFDAFTGALAGVTYVDQWESHVAKVGGKVFALRNSWQGIDQIVFKCPEETFEILTSIEGIRQAPYFAKRQWVSVSSQADLPEDDLKTYIRRSYTAVAGSLTKKLQRELGIISG